MLAFKNGIKSLRNLNKISSSLVLNGCISKQLYSTNDNESDNKRKGITSKGVKLYPGFQVSNEELKAKKLIEDFYGLNELEYEKDDEDDEIDKDKELLSSLKRDTSNNAVFSIESTIKLLRDENVENLCCIEIPKNLNYANFMIIGTSISIKHMNATCENFNKIYKKFKSNEDQFNKINGSKSQKWCVIDCGNIIIHLFQKEQREFYDLESLWCVDSEYDEKYQEIISQQNEMVKSITSLEVN